MASTDDRYRSTDDRYGGHRSMTFNRYRAQALYMCIQIHMMIRLPVGTSSIRGSILPSQFDSPSFKSQQFVSRGVPTLRAQPGMPVPVSLSLTFRLLLKLELHPLFHQFLKFSKECEENNSPTDINPNPQDLRTEELGTPSVSRYSLLIPTGCSNLRHYIMLIA